MKEKVLIAIAGFAMAISLAEFAFAATGSDTPKFPEVKTLCNKRTQGVRTENSGVVNAGTGSATTTRNSDRRG